MKIRTFDTTSGELGIDANFAHRLGQAMYQVGFSMGTLMLASVQVWQLVQNKGKPTGPPTPIYFMTPEGNGVA